MPEGFISIKLDSEARAKADAKRYSQDERTLYTVIRCNKSEGWFVCEGDGGLIRNFEEIVIRYEKGTVYKP